jgi:hypothetical protein
MADAGGGSDDEEDDYNAGFSVEAAREAQRLAAEARQRQQLAEQQRQLDATKQHNQEEEQRLVKELADSQEELQEQLRKTKAETEASKAQADKVRDLEAAERIVKARIKDGKNAAEALRAEVATMRGQKEDLDRELLQSRSQQELAEKEKRDLVEAKTELNEALAVINGQLEERHALLLAASDEYQAKNKELASLKADAASTEQHLAEVAAQAEHLDAQAQAHKEECSRLGELVSDAQVRLKEIEAKNQAQARKMLFLEPNPQFLIDNDETGFTLDCFFSHNFGSDTHGRDNHDRVSFVFKALTDSGLNCVFDTERSHHSVAQKSRISHAIHECTCVLLFITQAYDDLVNDEDVRSEVRFEYENCVDSRGYSRMIPVVMEEGMRDPRTWGTELRAVAKIDYVDWADEGIQPSPAKCQELVSRIRAVQAANH